MILSDGLERHPVRLLAYCLMSNHWHLVVGPVGTRQLARLLHWVTTTHAIRWRKRYRTVGLGPVYQGRFKAVPILATAELMRTCRYVERNALRAGLVRRAQDWPWCSLSHRLRPDPLVPLVSTPFLTSPAWLDYVNTARASEELGRPGTSKARTVENRPVPQKARSVENRPVPLRDVAEDPGGGGRKGGKRGGGVRRRDDEHETDAHVERAKHLRLRNPARLLQPAKDRRHLPALAIE
jgi:REP element-mobilizing transposase RayT